MMALKTTDIDQFITSKRWNRKSPPKKILAIRLQAMGDVVITLPYLQYLRNKLPEGSKLDFLTRDESADIPRNMFLFDRVYSIGGGRNFKKQLIHTFLMLPALAMQRYDMVIDLQNNILSEIARKTIRPRAWSVFDRYSSRPAGERTRLTIEAAGIECKVCNSFDFKPLQNTVKLLEANGWNGKDLLVVINPAGAFETRNWPIENYISFMRLWLNSYPGTKFLLLGTSLIEAKATYMQERLGDKVINLTNKTTPVEAFAILQTAGLVLSEDSGLMHMAWTSGIPTVVLFGGTRSDWARPLGHHSFFLDSSDLPCGNCMQATCMYGDTRCLARYSAERVFVACNQLFQKTSNKNISAGNVTI